VDGFGGFELFFGKKWFFFEKLRYSFLVFLIASGFLSESFKKNYAI